jgi:hypothetical protein
VRRNRLVWPGAGWARESEREIVNYEPPSPITRCPDVGLTWLSFELK